MNKNKPHEVFVTNRITTTNYATEVAMLISVVQLIVLIFIAFQVTI
jgi:hypothetical protein